MISNAAIMGHMTVGHKEIIITDARLPASFTGSPGDRYMLPEDIIVTNNQEGFFTLKLQILRIAADGRAVIKFIVTANPGPTVNNHMGPDNASIAQLHMLPDYRIRTDDHILPYFRARVDNGCFMNLSQGYNFLCLFLYNFHPKTSKSFRRSITYRIRTAVFISMREDCVNWDNIMLDRAARYQSTKLLRFTKKPIIPSSFKWEKHKLLANDLLLNGT